MNLKYLKTIFQEPKQLQVLLFGMISGMPFGLLYTTLIVWLNDYKIDISIMTLFGLAKLPYSLKFLWSWLVDNLRIPYFYQFGKRKSWMILCTILNIIIILIFANISPADNLILVGILSLLMGFISATFDISYDACRIEMFDSKNQSKGVAITSMGFKTGALLTSSSGLLLVNYFGWQLTFTIISGVFGLLLVFMIRSKLDFITSNQNSFEKLTFKNSVALPFQALLNQDKIFIILSGILLFKLGDSMLSIMGIPFYLEVGFSKTQVALVIKIVAMIATLLGLHVGGLICAEVGQMKGLIICGLSQMITNLLYIIIHHYPTMPVFIVCNFAENFTGGMGGAALVGFISNLCNKKFTATHYALLSSIATFMNNTVTSSSGYIAKGIGWDYFFIFTFIISIPGVAIFTYLNRFTSIESKNTVALDLE